jgi:hypothetical protein
MNEGAIIFAGGALAGAIGSLWFIVRSVPGAGTKNEMGKRKLAMMLVLAVYAVMALLAVAIGLAIRNTGIAGVAGVVFLVAAAALALVWQSDAA